MFGKDVVTRSGAVKVMRLEVVVGFPTVRVVLEKNSGFRLAVYVNEDVVVERAFDDAGAAFDAYRAVKGALCGEAEAVQAALKRVAEQISDGSDGGER